MNGSKLYLYDFTDCRRIDQQCQEVGLSDVQLMGQAALASLYALEKYAYIPNPPQRILILCGPGNNGGDGLALAYLLAGHSLLHSSPKILVFHSSGKIKTSAARFYADRLQELKLPLYASTDFLQETVGSQDLVIEALLGSGQRAAPSAEIQSMLLNLRRLRCQPEARRGGWPGLISLDIPAGLSEKEPAIFLPPGSPVKKERYSLAAPDEVYCYGVDKLALRLSSSLCAHTRTRLLSIGFHPACILRPQRKIWRYQQRAGESPLDIFYRDPGAHKYTAGHGLLVGGSIGMEGALLMAARSFFAAGGGILHSLVPDPSTRQFLSQAMPTGMFYDCENFSTDIRPHGILIGPGLKKEDMIRIKPLIQKWLQTHPKEQPYFLLDAAATTLVSALELPLHRTILLPHTGEWRALGGPAISDTDSLYAALSFYETQFKCHVLVKDSISALFSPLGGNAEVMLYTRPDPALSVAGSGDNLAGILLALFSRKNTATHEDPCVQKKVWAGLSLLHAAASRRLHPRSDEFAAGIEQALLRRRDSK